MKLPRGIVPMHAFFRGDGRLDLAAEVVMQSMDQFLCYGKRLIARRLGLGEVHDRQPALAPSAFGLACLERHAARLDPWP